jgi:CTP:phosphocholine cytidylyltransferase-like protein
MKHPAPRIQSTGIDSQHGKTKWATSTYRGKETRKITKLFKDTHVKTSFRKQNTAQNITKHHPQTDKYNTTGIYQMKCLDCPQKYIGQRGKTFHTVLIHNIIPSRM